MRTHQRNLMLVITILTIISFAFFYSYTDPSKLGSDTAVRMYDRNITRGDFDRDIRKFNLALQVGLTEYASTLGGGSEQGGVEFAVNSIIIDEQGRKLGLKPKDSEIQAAIMALPAFQTGGQFDRNKYAMITNIALSPAGLSPIDLDNLVANYMMFEKIRKIINSVPAVTEGEAAKFKKVFQAASGAAVVFDEDVYAKNIKITDAQVSDFLKANAARFVTPEFRTARYVTFPLPADLSKLEGKAKIEAQQKVADASDAFWNKATAEGFEKAAKEANLKIETTLPFESNGSIKSVAGINTEELEKVTDALAPEVFTLSKTTPVSRVIQSGDNFIVAELGEITPSRPMKLEEAKPEIVSDLTQTAAAAALEKGAAEALANLRTALKSGKSFTEAATAAGLKVVPFTNVSLMDEKAEPEQRQYVDASILIEEGELSGLRREPSGGYAVWLEKRAPIDQAKFDAQGPAMISGILQQRQAVLWHEWISNAQKESGLRFPGSDRS